MILNLECTINRLAVGLWPNPMGRGAGRAGADRARAPNFDWGGECPPPNLVRLKMLHITKFLASFHQRPPIQASECTKFRPDPHMGAHISRLCLCIAISWPLDIWLSKLIMVFYFIMFICSPSFSLAALHHFMCIRCPKFMDVQLTLTEGVMSPQTLVWNKCCLNYKISWIFATSGLYYRCQNAPNSFCVSALPWT